ncbi:hypothetical protein HanIR_Chr11g0511851 [Helianthus annuus]|nr:hypothetical protein HanIR_Chr11g0511851 [Helianthus annuus]
MTQKNNCLGNDTKVITHLHSRCLPESSVLACVIIVGPAWDRQFSSHKGGYNQEEGGCV